MPLSLHSAASSSTWSTVITLAHTSLHPADRPCLYTAAAVCRWVAAVAPCQSRQYVLHLFCCSSYVVNMSNKKKLLNYTGPCSVLRAGSWRRYICPGALPCARVGEAEWPAWYWATHIDPSNSQMEVKLLHLQPTLAPWQRERWWERENRRCKVQGRWNQIQWKEGKNKGWREREREREVTKPWVCTRSVYCPSAD